MLGCVDGKGLPGMNGLPISSARGLFLSSTPSYPTPLGWPMLPPSLRSSSVGRRATPAITILAQGEFSRICRVSSSVQFAIGLSLQTGSAAISKIAEQGIKTSNVRFINRLLNRHLKLIANRTLRQDVARVLWIRLQLPPKLFHDDAHVLDLAASIALPHRLRESLGSKWPVGLSYQALQNHAL